MRCEYCGRTTADAAPPCPHCPDAHNADLLSRTYANGETPRTVIEPEVVDEHESCGGQRYFSRTARENSGAQFSFASWKVNGNISSDGLVGGSSCLPIYITLFMLALCAVRFGVLAAVGFLFFYIIGSGIAIFAGLQRMIQGRTVNLWIPRIINWVACWLLVGWLSKGF